MIFNGRKNNKKQKKNIFVDEKDNDIDNISNDPHEELINWYSRKVLNYDEKDLKGVCMTSSTESLFCAMYTAKCRFLIESKTAQPPIYVSSEAHSGIVAISQTLNLPLFRINAKKYYGMDMDLLREAIDDEPYAIVIFTMGDVKNQIYDDIELFYNEVIGKLPNTKLYLHIDGTIGGMVYPFLKKKLLLYPFDSINVSLHRHIETKNNCSLTIFKSEYEEILNFFINSNSKSILSNIDVKQILDEYIYIPNQIKNHIQSLITCVDKKQYLLELCPLISCCHELSFVMYIKNIANENKTKLENLNVIPYGESNEHEYKAYFRINKYTSEYVLDSIIEILEKREKL